MNRFGTLLLVVLSLIVTNMLMVKRTLEGAITEVDIALSRAMGILQVVRSVPAVGGRDTSAVAGHRPGPSSETPWNRRANAELELMHEVRAHASRVQSTTIDLVAARNNGARITIPDANRLLPCGDAVPRLVASEPAREAWVRLPPAPPLPIGPGVGPSLPESVAEATRFVCEDRHFASSSKPESRGRADAHEK